MAVNVTLENGEVKRVEIPQSVVAPDGKLELCDRIDNYLAENYSGNSGWSCV